MNLLIQKSDHTAVKGAAPAAKSPKAHSQRDFAAAPSAFAQLLGSFVPPAPTKAAIPPADMLKLGNQIPVSASPSSIHPDLRAPEVGSMLLPAAGVRGNAPPHPQEFIAFVHSYPAPEPGSKAQDVKFSPAKSAQSFIPNRAPSPPPHPEMSRPVAVAPQMPDFRAGASSPKNAASAAATFNLGSQVSASASPLSIHPDLKVPDVGSVLLPAAGARGNAPTHPQEFVASTHASPVPDPGTKAQTSSMDSATGGGFADSMKGKSSIGVRNAGAGSSQPADVKFSPAKSAQSFIPNRAPALRSVIEIERPVSVAPQMHDFWVGASSPKNASIGEPAFGLGSGATPAPADDLEASRLEMGDLEQAGDDIRNLLESWAGKSAPGGEESPGLTLSAEGHSSARGGLASAGSWGSSAGSALGRGATFIVAAKPNAPKSKDKEENAAAMKRGASTRAARPLPAKVSSKSRAAVSAAADKMVPEMNRESKVARQTNLQQAPALPAKIEYLQNLSRLAEKIKACAQLRQGGDTALEIHLTPPRLGSLLLRVQTQGDEMRLYFGTERDAAAAMLKEMRADLSHIAAEQGYDLKRCDVEYQALQDHRPPAQGGVWADRQQPSRQRLNDLAASTRDFPDEPVEEIPRMLDFGYNTLDLVA